MRSFTALACQVVVCLGCWLLAIDSPAAQGQVLSNQSHDRPETDVLEPAAADNFAGVFLGTFTGLAEPIHFLLTLERDGVFTASDTTDFGIGGIGSLESDQHGVWKSTGPLQVTGRSLHFFHDPATGELAGVNRQTWVVDFISSLTEGSGSSTLQVFAPFQVLDPLDPNTNAEPLGGSIVLSLTLKRLAIDNDCGNNSIDPGEECDGTDDAACPGQCNPSTCECSMLVSLASFTADATEGGVLLRWTTALEIDNVGFHVLRTAEGSTKGLDVLTPDLIFAAGSDLAGADYRFLDDTRHLSGTLVYYLEDVDTLGRTTRHGPVTVELAPSSGARTRTERRR